MSINNTITLINEDGVEVVYDVLFTFDHADNGKSYIVYTDNQYDESGNVQVFASIYDPTLDKPKLEPIETDQEWELIQNIIDSLQDEIRNGNKKDVDEIIDAVVNRVSDKIDKAEVMDDFSMYDDYMNEYKSKYMIIKLHFYKKDTYEQSTHGKHHKIGEAIITGSAGKFTIGSSIVSDIVVDNSDAIKPLHMMGILLNKKVYVANLSTGNATLNHHELQIASKEVQFYEITHKQYFTMGNQIKVYAEILDEYEMVDHVCPLCKSEFFSMSDNDEYCVECFKQIEEEMKLDLSDILKCEALERQLYPRQTDDLDIVVKPSDSNNPQLLMSLFEIC